MGNQIEEAKKILIEEGSLVSLRLLNLLREIEGKRLSEEEAKALIDEALQVAKISGFKEEALRKLKTGFEILCSATFLL